HIISTDAFAVICLSRLKNYRLVAADFAYYANTTTRTRAAMAGARSGCSAQCLACPKIRTLATARNGSATECPGVEKDTIGQRRLSVGEAQLGLLCANQRHSPSRSAPVYGPRGGAGPRCGY